MDSEARTRSYAYKYASLGAVRDSIIPVLNRHGLALVQLPAAGEHGPALTTLLLHQSGQWAELGTLSIPVAELGGAGVRLGAVLLQALFPARRAGRGRRRGRRRRGGAAACGPVYGPAPRHGGRPRPRLRAPLVARGLCKDGELIAHLLADDGRAAARPEDWGPDMAEAVAASCRAFEALCRDAQPVSPEQAASLLAALKRKGRSFLDVVRKLKLARGVKATELSLGAYKAVLEMIGQLPDVGTNDAA